jgi:hypothetical protein
MHGVFDLPVPPGPELVRIVMDRSLGIQRESPQWNKIREYG